MPRDRLQEDFGRLCTAFGIANRSLVDSITANPGPLTYAHSVTSSVISEGNDYEHSIRVLRLCIGFSRCLPQRHSLTVREKLILVYASLLHDISKSKSDDVSNEINSVLHSSCHLFSNSQDDHGIRSAYYLRHKLETKSLRLPGIGPGMLPRLLSVIAYHNSGIMDNGIGPRPTGIALVKLCMLFRLADIADGERHRVRAGSTVEPVHAAEKTQARALVDEVKITDSSIIWRVSDDTPALRKAVALANETLGPFAMFLQSFCLPYRIVATHRGQPITVPAEPPLPGPIATSATRNSELILRADSFAALYEKIVLAMHPLGTDGLVTAAHYCGPVVLEVSNPSLEGVIGTPLRNAYDWTVEDVRRCTQTWLSDRRDDAKEFYFGYTHGQRIYRYLYPDAEKELVDPEKFQLSDWTGEIDQFQECVSALRVGGADTRRAYLSIPHPLIDNHNSKYHKDEEVAPSLLAFHFYVESGNRLSGFALLRSQELSLFSLVNFLETITIMDRLISELRGSIPDLVMGRVVMMSSLAYFDPYTTLLRKPKVCTVGHARIRTLCSNIEQTICADELERLLKEYAAHDYLKTETGWCDWLARYLPRPEWRAAAETLKTRLEDLGERRTKGEPGTVIVKEKVKAVEAFLETVAVST